MDLMATRLGASRGGGLLVIGPHHIGDTLIALPALHWLTQMSRWERLAIVVNDRTAPLASLLLDRPPMVPCPPSYQTRRSAIYHGVRVGLRGLAGGFEAALDLRGDLTAALAMIVARARRRHGAPSEPRRALSWLRRAGLHLTHQTSDLSSVRCAHDFYMQVVGDLMGRQRPSLAQTLELARSLGVRLHPSRQLEPRGGVRLCPGASSEQKRWDPARWASLASRLLDDGRAVSVLVAAHETDLELALRRAGLPIEVAITRDRSVLEFATNLRGAAVAVTCDSAASHLAFLVGVPVVTVFVSTDPETWFPYDRVRRGRAVQADARYGAGRDPSPEAVLAAIADLRNATLSGQSRP